MSDPLMSMQGKNGSDPLADAMQRRANLQNKLDLDKSLNKFNTTNYTSNQEKRPDTTGGRG